MNQQVNEIIAVLFAFLMISAESQNPDPNFAARRLPATLWKMSAMRNGGFRLSIWTMTSAVQFISQFERQMNLRRISIIHFDCVKRQGNAGDTAFGGCCA